MKQMIKDAVILFLITVISGALLGLVYQVTKDPIRLQQEKAQKEAYQEVFNAADSFEEVCVDTDMLTGNAIENGFDAQIDSVVAALDSSKNTLGYVITVTDHEGYGGDIQFSVGVTKEGLVNGISILQISETAGLGMRAEEVLKPQFTNKQVESFSYTKTGSTNDSEIDAISSATITSNAVVNGVNAALDCFRSSLSGLE